MVGLILLYFIGKYFYDLAIKHNKHKWGYAILGVVVNYAGAIVLGAVLFIILELGEWADIDSIDETSAGLMAMPFGLLTCWAIYALLKRNWSKRSANLSEDILDAGELERF